MKKSERKNILNTLKNKSPFTKHFVQIQEEASESISFETSAEKENQFFCVEVISHLLNKYMPYCFLWASFTLKDLPENNLTRFTNGTLEKKFGTRKSRSKNHLKLNPAQYAIDSQDYANGLATQFKSHYENKFDENNNIIDEKSELEFEDDAYQDANTAEEGWNKKEKKEGSYQKARKVDFQKWLKEKKEKSILKINKSSKNIKKKKGNLNIT